MGFTCAIWVDVKIFFSNKAMCFHTPIHVAWTHHSHSKKKRQIISNFIVTSLSVLWFKDAWFRSPYLRQILLLCRLHFLLIFIYDLLLVQFFLSNTGSLNETWQRICSRLVHKNLHIVLKSKFQTEGSKTFDLTRREFRNFFKLSFNL